MKNVMFHQMDELIKTQAEILLVIHTLVQLKSRQGSSLTWLDAQDVLLQYHLSKRTLLRLRTKGLLQSYKLEGKIYYSKEELQQLIVAGNQNLSH